MEGSPSACSDAKASLFFFLSSFLTSMSLTCHSISDASLSFFSLSLSLFFSLKTHKQHDKPKPWDHEGIDHWTIPKFEKVKN